MALGALYFTLGLATSSAHATTVTFISTGREQALQVPAGVSTVHVVAVGGRGGYDYAGGDLGGFGAVASADVSVTLGETLYVEVGADGAPGDTGAAPGSGGFNGGGNGGNVGGGGGGASDVRTVSTAVPGSLGSRVVVAGGGGGAGTYPGGANAGEGGSIYGDGGPASGTAGGAGGPPNGEAQSGASGVLGQGGAGGLGDGDSGGGGGGGLYGGGGGGGGGPLCSTMYDCAYMRGGNGGGGSSGFGQGASNPVVAGDTTGIPSVTITYTSNALELSSLHEGSADTISFTAKVPGSGHLTAVATARVPSRFRSHKTAGKIDYGKTVKAATGSNAIKLQIRPYKAVRRLLEQGAQLPVTITVSFTPTGGTTNEDTIHLLVKARS